MLKALGLSSIRLRAIVILVFLYPCFIMCFPLTIVVAKTFMKPFGKGFRVTRKEFTSDEAVPVPGYPMLLLFLLYAVAILVGASRTFWLAVDAPFVIYSLWSTYRMVFFWLAFQGAVELPQRRNAVRFQRPFTLSVSNADDGHLA